MDSFMKMVLKDFIENNWHAFLHFCNQFVEDGEALAEEILGVLET